MPVGIYKRTTNKGFFKKGHTSFLTEDSKKKISKTMKGIEHSEEAKRKMSLAAKGKSKSEEHKKKTKRSKIETENGFNILY